MQAHNRSLPDWFSRVRTRQIALPRFQRYEAWTHANVAQLFNTILQELPVGAVLVLEIGDVEPFARRELPGAPDDGERVTEHLLDGQQRLVALWRGLHNNYPDRTYFLFLETAPETRMPFYVDSLARWKREGDKELRPFWANRPEDQWKRRAVPLELCAPGDETWQKFRQWAREAITDADEREGITDFVQRVREKLLTFNLPYLALPVKTPAETALDVFMKMNTTAAPLSMYDIVVAQVEAAAETSLRDLVADTREVSPHVEAYYSPEELTLAAGALLQGKPPTKSTYLSRNFSERLIENWERYKTGLKRAIPFLEEERIYDTARLPTDVVVPVLVALWADAPEGLDSEGHARWVLRRYLWRAFFSRRYESSTNTRALADHNELKAFIGNQDAKIPTVLNDQETPLPEPMELENAGWPKKKDRLARGILALSLREGGLDLADGSEVTRANLARREYHHLFPVSWLRKNSGGELVEPFLALNCALVTWRTNRNISDKAPERYLGERGMPGDPADSQIKARLESHLIPYDELVAGQYAAFLDKRAEWVHARMKQLCCN